MPKPNLLIVMVDQMRLQAMGFWNTPGFKLPYNSDPVYTPNLDRFAKQSLVLSQAVSNNPVCSPYRAMLMSGQYSPNNGCPSNCNSNTAPYDCELPTDTRCWSDVLKDQGYSLGYIGKWHLDAPRSPYVDCANNRGQLAWNEWCPPERRHGFDFWYSYGTYDMHMNPLYWSNDADRLEHHYAGQWGPEHEADLAIKYLTNKGEEYRGGDRPFALVVSMNPPHTPFNQFPERYLAPYEGKNHNDLLNRPNVALEGDSDIDRCARENIKAYLAMVTGIDDQFGRIVDCLDKLGLAEETIVLFTSDHGCCMGSNAQMYKSVHYEESMMIPFMIRWPGKIPIRHDCELLLSVPDTYPTLLDLMGLQELIPDQVEGESYAKYFMGETDTKPTSALYHLFEPEIPQYGRRGVRTARYTLVIELAQNTQPITTLHDNSTDPYQLKNIAQERPDLVAGLIGEELVPWLQKIGDPWLQTARQLGIL